MLSSFSFTKASSSVADAGGSRTALRRNREPPAFLVAARRRRTARLMDCAKRLQEPTHLNGVRCANVASASDKSNSDEIDRRASAHDEPSCVNSAMPANLLRSHRPKSQIDFSFRSAGGWCRHKQRTRFAFGTTATLKRRRSFTPRPLRLRHSDGIHGRHPDSLSLFGTIRASGGAGANAYCRP